MVAGHGIDAAGNHPVMAVIDLAFGSVLLDINGSTLTLRNLRSEGAINDTVVIEKNPPSGSRGIDPQDVNGDQKADIVWRNTSNGTTAVWLMNGTSIAVSGFPGGVPKVWQIVGAGDVNGDGKGDVIWRNTSNGTVATWLMNG